MNRIRRDIGILDTSKKVIEQTSIRISLIHDIGDALHTLEPTTNVETCQQTNCKLMDGIEHFEMKTFTKSMLEDILKKTTRI